LIGGIGRTRRNATVAFSRSTENNHELIVINIVFFGAQISNREKNAYFLRWRKRRSVAACAARTELHQPVR
jgi:hypothetical protein